MNINALPDLALFTIFDNVPLFDLLHINKVCSRWCTLRQAALARRRTLYIVPHSRILESLNSPKCTFDLLRETTHDDGSLLYPQKQRLDRHSLVFPIFTLAALDHITDLLPNIKILRIITHSAPIIELWKFKYLLHNYRYSLTELTLWFWAREQNGDGDDDGGDDEENDTSDPEVVREYFLSTIRSINALSELKNLELNLQTPFDLNTYGSIPLDLSIIRQLEELNIRTCGFSSEGRGDLEVLVPSLHQYAEPNPNLREVILHNFVHLQTALLYAPKLASVITELHIEDAIDPEKLEQFQLFCSRFTSLRDLSLRIDSLSMAAIAGAIAPLKNLVHLSLNINFDPAFGNISPKNEIPVEEMTVNPSVKALSLFIDTKSHLDIEQMSLPTMYPNVQVVLMRHFAMQCSACDYIVDHSPDVPEVPRQTIHDCMKQARLSFKQFRHLKFVLANVGPLQQNQAFREFKFTKESLDTIDTMQLLPGEILEELEEFEIPEDLRMANLIPQELQMAIGRNLGLWD